MSTTPATQTPATSGLSGGQEALFSLLLKTAEKFFTSCISKEDPRYFPSGVELAALIVAIGPPDEKKTGEPEVSPLLTRSQPSMRGGGKQPPAEYGLASVVNCFKIEKFQDIIDVVGFIGKKDLVSGKSSAYILQLKCSGTKLVYYLLNQTTHYLSPLMCLDALPDYAIIDSEKATSPSKITLTTLTKVANKLSAKDSTAELSFPGWNGEYATLKYQDYEADRTVNVLTTGGGSRDQLDLATVTWVCESDRNWINFLNLLLLKAAGKTPAEMMGVDESKGGGFAMQYGWSGKTWGGSVAEMPVDAKKVLLRQIASVCLTEINMTQWRAYLTTLGGSDATARNTALDQIYQVLVTKLNSVLASLGVEGKQLPLTRPA